MKKGLLVTILSSVLAMALCCGCGNSASSFASEEAMPMSAKSTYADAPYVAGNSYGSDMASMEYTEDADYDAEFSYDDSAESAVESVDVDDNAAAAKSDRKLIRNVNISTETKEFDALLGNVKQQVAQLGGYIESLNEYQDTWREQTTRNASLTIRVPKDKADQLITSVEDGSNIISHDENLEDVTLAYVDMESHKKALETEQERLLELMEKAETIEDIIRIEERLTNVRYQIESMESQLRTYDNKIDYTTINLQISEVKELTPTVEKGYFEKMGEGFLESTSGVFVGLANFISWFIVHIPYFILWAVIIILVMKFIVKPWKKRRAAKKAMVSGDTAQAASFKKPGFLRRFSKKTGEFEAVKEVVAEEKTEETAEEKSEKKPEAEE